MREDEANIFAARFCLAVLGEGLRPRPMRLTAGLPSLDQAVGAQITETRPSAELQEREAELEPGCLLIDISVLFVVSVVETLPPGSFFS